MTREEAIPVIDILISQYFVEAHNNGYLDYQRAEIIEALEMAKEALEKGHENCTDELTFLTMRESCKYGHDSYIDGHFDWTCRHNDNIPAGCSWGTCDMSVCPILKGG